MKKSLDRYVAIEGPVCAGKTTLCANICHKFRGICVVPDYSDFAGGGKNLPSAFPHTLHEEANALSFFQGLERRRFLQHDNKDADICLVDRSAHTLLAHCFSITHLSGTLYFDLALNILSKASAVVWPTFVLFLDIPHSTILERNTGKFGQDNIFICQKYNNYYRKYFISAIETFGNANFYYIDARKTKSSVCDEAVRLLRKNFSLSDIVRVLPS